jgi:hypothetical protein
MRSSPFHHFVRFQLRPSAPERAAVDRRWRALGGTALLAALMLVSGCSLGGSSTAAAPTTLASDKVPWCGGSVSLTFIDNGSSSQTTLTNWKAVSSQLGFTPYLPDSFPLGTCLVLAGGTIHDPVYGGHLVVTWNLPGNISLSFSEAPKRANLSGPLQCTQSSQQSTTSICLGTVSNTGITIASNQSSAKVRALFSTLKPNVTWLPANTNQLLATPSATASS